MKSIQEIMKIVHESWDSELIEKTISDAIREGWQDGFKAGERDSRSRDYAARNGHEMGQ